MGSETGMGKAKRDEAAKVRKERKKEIERREKRQRAKVRA